MTQITCYKKVCVMHKTHTLNYTIHISIICELNVYNRVMNSMPKIWIHRRFLPNKTLSHIVAPLPLIEQFGVCGRLG